MLKLLCANEHWESTDHIRRSCKIPNRPPAPLLMVSIQHHSLLWLFSCFSSAATAEAPHYSSYISPSNSCWPNCAPNQTFSPPSSVIWWSQNASKDYCGIYHSHTYLSFPTSTSTPCFCNPISLSKKLHCSNSHRAKPTRFALHWCWDEHTQRWEATQSTEVNASLCLLPGSTTMREPAVCLACSQEISNDSEVMASSLPIALTACKSSWISN